MSSFYISKPIFVTTNTHWKFRYDVCNTSLHLLQTETFMFAKIFSRNLYALAIIAFRNGLSIQSVLKLQLGVIINESHHYIHRQNEKCFQNDRRNVRVFTWWFRRSLAKHYLLIHRRFRRQFEFYHFAQNGTGIGCTRSRVQALCLCRESLETRK